MLVNSFCGNASSWVLFIIAVAANPIIRANAQTQGEDLKKPPLSQTFDATGHVKANGAQVTVKYPAGWKDQEGARAKAIHNFAGDYDGVPAVLSLSIETHDADVERACAGATKDHWIQGSAAGNWSVTRAHAFSRQGKPSALIDATIQPVTLDGFTIYSRAQSMVVCHKHYIVKAVCVTSNNTFELARASMKKITPLCQQYFDNLKLKG